jgi:hypothetical protein
LRAADRTRTLRLALNRVGRALLGRSPRVAGRLVVEHDVGEVLIRPAAVTVSR